MNRPDPWTALHSNNLPARIRVLAIGDDAVPPGLRARPCCGVPVLCRAGVMTGFSTFGTRRLRLVDGDLSTDDELRAEQFDQVASTLACGVARVLLDTCHDRADPDRPVRAEQWHTPVEGWELDAVCDDDRPELMRQVRWFAAANLLDVLALAERIAWDEATAGLVWHGDTGRGLYRVAMLLGHHGARTGLGFADHARRSDLPADRPRHGRSYRGLPGQLTMWAATGRGPLPPLAGP